MTPPGAVRRFLPYCGLPCPPALLTLEGERVVAVEGACAVCREEALAPRLTEALIAGQATSIDAALARAVDLLAASRRPFVYGLAASPVETARLAARLAARLDAAVDVEGAETLQAELATIAATGQVTSTFGEMRASADVVVLWRLDPRVTHPDFLPGALENGGRRFVVVPPLTEDDGRPLPFREGDHVLDVPAGRDLEALQSLRGVLSGRGPAPPLEGLQAAAEILRSAGRAALLWDGSLASRTAEGPAIAAGFALLTLDASAAPPGAGSGAHPAARGPRLAAKALGARGNLAGAMAGLLSATGFPRAIGFSSGRPQADPDRFGAPRMIDGGGADLVLAIEPLRMDRLSSRPAIVIGSRLPGGTAPDVFIPVAPPALSGDGLWLRADGVPVPRPGGAGPGSGPRVRASVGALPSESDVLEALLDRLRAAA